MKTMNELEDELCNYCDRPEDRRGVSGGPNGPIFYCDNDGCEIAYENYLYEMEENK